METGMRASAEDYLETILLLSQKNGAVRAIDVAGETGFSKPSVSVAMKKLREGGLITVGEGGQIHLTARGAEEAARVYERHSTLYEWLKRIGVSEAVAAADACRMEHILNAETFEAIKRLSENLPGV